MGYKNIKHSILFSFLFWVGSVQSGYAQETAGQEAVPEMQTAVFTPPFDFPITFSGNFGEIRSNHFHGGLDFKTGGVIGKPVHALADGHISRIGQGCAFSVKTDGLYDVLAVSQDVVCDSPGKHRVTLEYGQAVPYALADAAFLGGFQSCLYFLNALGRLHGVHGIF